MKSIPYTKENLQKAVDNANSYAQTLRNMDRLPVGSNYSTVKNKIKLYQIDTSHFDPYLNGSKRGGTRPIDLDKVMTKNSSYPRGTLKKRLLRDGILKNECSLCGQGDSWQGKKLTLILDHINGVSNDHRLENLRIVCPNCNSTLDTHCGRNMAKAGILPPKSTCPQCRQKFQPSKNNPKRKYCSAGCHSKTRGRYSRRASNLDKPCVVCKSENKLNPHNKTCSEKCRRKLISDNASKRQKGIARPSSRKTKRPSYKKLISEVKRDGYRATGRKYGVSDNAVRKWIQFYEKQ